MNKKDEVYELLVGRLVSADYKFGQRLSVKDVAVDTGASRQPIMAALNRLHAEGFVRIIPQVGCEVISPSRDEIADFYLMFERMEGLLAELAAARHTAPQLNELRWTQERIQSLDQSSSRGKEYSVLNRRFHQIIHDMAHSRFVDERQSSNFNMSDFFINQSVGFRSVMTDVAKEHDDIIDAIAARSPSRARNVTEVHIADVARAVSNGIRSG